MSEYTPAPWVVEPVPERFFWQIFSASHHFVASVPTGGNKNSDAQKIRKRADAQLISAAPDLLEALALCLVQLESESMPSDEVMHALHHARSAIVKAVCQP